MGPRHFSTYPNHYLDCDCTVKNHQFYYWIGFSQILGMIFLNKFQTLFHSHLTCFPIFSRIKIQDVDLRCLILIIPELRTSFKFDLLKLNVPNLVWSFCYFMGISFFNYSQLRGFRIRSIIYFPKPFLPRLNIPNYFLHRLAFTYTAIPRTSS